MIGGDVPFYVKIWRILTHPLAQRQFQYIFAHSACRKKTMRLLLLDIRSLRISVIANEKVKLYE